MSPFLAELVGTMLLVILGAGKAGSDWAHAWIPVPGPVIGGIIGALFYKAL